jgi:hypothetical protein
MPDSRSLASRYPNLFKELGPFTDAELGLGLGFRCIMQEASGDFDVAHEFAAVFAGGRVAVERELLSVIGEFAGDESGNDVFSLFAIHGLVRER